jgi:hypothetical protein
VQEQHRVRHEPDYAGGRQASQGGLPLYMDRD